MESLNLQNLEERLAIEGGQKVYIKVETDLRGTPAFYQYEVIKVRQTFPPEEKKIFAVIFEIDEKDGSRGTMGRLYFDAKGKPSEISRSILACNTRLSFVKKYHKWYLSRL